MNAPVGAQFCSLCVDNIAGAGDQAGKGLNKPGIVPVGNKAYFLAVLIPGTGDTFLRDKRACLFLGYAAQGEKQVFHALLGQHEEKI